MVVNIYSFYDIKVLRLNYKCEIPRWLEKIIKYFLFFYKGIEILSSRIVRLTVIRKGSK